MSLRVLLVEDDRDLCALLCQTLRVEGYDVLSAASLAEAQALLAHAGRPGGAAGPAIFDLLVLDLGLPDGDGRELLRTVRRRQTMPVLIISARHDDRQKIMLLDDGADDYLVKPFSIGELLARMRVAWRHRGRSSEAAVTLYRRAGVHIDLHLQQVSRDDRLLHLTPTEYRLLARLVRSAGRVVTHRQLLVDVWGPDCSEQTQYLRLYMGQLRAKLEADPAEPRLLLTEPGTGYRLAPPEDDDIHMRS
ncbi:winged helix family two component transcriptional regulator [Sphaerotilus hippei]|uniref:Winged helix family two component transcriptional regulator n=1 Tax=Sphaerotilus hippei TaxID=744406 RepID=A0A318GZD8_9BURK|nr:response regulator [Sphaerotilus hippei]PXW95476.1 winged helix family two component transcriptional regulator [Sphaerotilus hippei]